MNELEKKIAEHEGYRSYVYLDTNGYATLGYGRNVSKNSGRGITRDEALILMRNDIKLCKTTLKHYLWYRHLDRVRQEVLIELMYNLGVPRFFTFKKMIGCLQMNDYLGAERELLDSKWRTDVGERRASDMAFRIRYGSYKGQALV